MGRPDEEAFRLFARRVLPGLRRTAYLLCGDWHAADDLVQVAGLKLFRSWSKIDRNSVPLNYARKVLVNCWLDERRRSWRRHEQLFGEVPETAVVGGGPVETSERREVRDQLLRALAAVPRGQRAVLVLRYFESMSVTETASALGCSEGTVKSQTSRGLTALKAAYGNAPVEAAGSPRDER